MHWRLASMCQHREVSKSSGNRRRARHGLRRSTKPSTLTGRRLAGRPMLLWVGLSAVTGLSVLNLWLRLWDSFEGWWVWLLAASFLAGAGAVLWFFARPEQLGPMALRPIGWVYCALVAASIAFPRVRHGQWVPALPDWLAAGAAMVLIGTCVGGAALLAGRTLRPSKRTTHRVFVDLYANPLLEPYQGHRVFPRLSKSSDGYYQARCRCGWFGSQHSIDSDTAEQDATADRDRHLRTVGDAP